MNFLLRVSVVLLPLFIGACSPPASPEAPTNVTATEGESLVVMEWDVQPDLIYWLIYNQGSSVGFDDYDELRRGVTSPLILSNRVNGKQYALSVMASKEGSKTSPISPVTATPRLLSPSTPWTIGTPLTVNDFLSIAFGNNTYVTVGDAATVFAGPYSYTSTGGVTAWTQVTSLPVTVSTNLRSVIHDGSSFVALGDDGSVIKSSNSTTWEAATAIAPTSALNALAYNAATYVAVGDDGLIYTNTSSGITEAWIAQTSGTANNLYGVSFVNDRFIAVGALGTLLTSIDGITWTTQSSNTNSTLRQVAFGADNYVSVGDAGAVVSSVDATTWTAQTIPTTESFRSIIFGVDLQFIAVGTTGLLAYSLTGTDGSWAVTNAGLIDLNSIASNAVFIATGAAGANVSGK